MNRRSAAWFLTTGLMALAAAFPCGLLLQGAAPLGAQESLERWLDDLLPRSFRSIPGQLPGLPAGPELLERVPSARASASARVHRFGLGPYALHRQVADAFLEQPLTSPDVTLDLGASHRVDSRLDLDRGALRSDAPSAVDAGVTGRLGSRAGRWGLRLGGGWVGGGRWSASLAGASRFHRLVATHDSGRDGDLRLRLPGPAVEGRSHTGSSRSSAAAELRWPDGRFGGSGVGLAWSRASFEPIGRSDGPMLEALIAGAREVVGIGARLRILEPVRLRMAFRRARIGADGALARSGQRAGRLFFGQLRSERWTVALTDPSGGARWKGGVSWGRAGASLSARLETWPFGEVWDQLGAVAYRVRADLETRWTAASWSRGSGTGSGWGLEVQRVRVGLDGEDWVVTGLGFGRSDQRSLENLDASALLVGGELRLRLPGTEGRGSVRLDGSVPVSASWNGAVGKGLVGSEWLGGWSRWVNLGVMITWSSGPSLNERIRSSPGAEAGATGAAR